MLPDTKPWVWFEKVAQDLDAPVITIWLGARPTLWICDAWAADELLNKVRQNYALPFLTDFGLQMAGIYSSRPRMVVCQSAGLVHQLEAHLL